MGQRGDSKLAWRNLSTSPKVPQTNVCRLDKKFRVNNEGKIDYWFLRPKWFRVEKCFSLFFLKEKKWHEIVKLFEPKTEILIEITFN